MDVRAERASSTSTADEGPEDDALETALDAGAEDFKAEDEQYEITTEPTAMHAVRSALEAKGYEISEAEIASVPKNLVNVEGRLQSRW